MSHPSFARRSIVRPSPAKRASVALGLVLGLAACGDPARDEPMTTAMSGERYAHALLRAPTRKP